MLIKFKIKKFYKIKIIKIQLKLQALRMNKVVQLLKILKIKLNYFSSKNNYKLNAIKVKTIYKLQIFLLIQ